MIDFGKEFSKYLGTDSQKERFKELLNLKAKNAKGDPAVDFKFQNSEGKEVALSDFKGKVVYIDIWATWCGPCKKEIPHLKMLEEEYKGKNVVFLGVSIDVQKDHPKWQKFLIDNKMKGIQLFAGDKAGDISKPYKIKGIPRFMLIDKDGKIVSSDAPRPSSPEIKLLLNSTLLKK
ncbi:TlpA family protein disulfide reductase [Dysgonomonas sp. Marseille-P4677]|nr:TlpA family protein disulfide reductase [Dysgonomonas sp. Marseille-P4677]